MTMLESTRKSSASATPTQASACAVLTRDGTNAAPILVVALGPLQASVTLFFDLLPLSVRHLVRVIFAGDVDIKAQIVQAQAVVFVRGLVEYEALIAFAKRAEVPMYHYCDDNFIVVGEESARYGADYAFYTRDNIRNTLRDFAGCLLSVPNLLDFYRDNALHEHLYLFPPIAAFDEYGAQPHDYPASRPFTMSFFGGGDRRDAFINYIVPALKRLSKARAIDLIAFGIAPSDVDCKAYPNLRVYYPPYEPDYTLAIRQFRHYAPNVMLHSSSATRNNRYKNCNNIINGVLAGAAMICSRTEPYLGLDECAATLLADDSVESWYLAMWQFVNSDTRLRAFYAGAKAYCEAEYSGVDNVRAVHLILGASPPVSASVMAHRWMQAASQTAITISNAEAANASAAAALAAQEAALLDGQAQQHAIRSELYHHAQQRIHQQAALDGVGST